MHAFPSSRVHESFVSWVSCCGSGVYFVHASFILFSYSLSNNTRFAKSTRKHTFYPGYIYNMLHNIMLVNVWVNKQDEGSITVFLPLYEHHFISILWPVKRLAHNHDSLWQEIAFLSYPHPVQKREKISVTFWLLMNPRWLLLVYMTTFPCPFTT